MKKLLLSLAATAICSTAFAAVGDEKVILDQTFNEETVLTNTSEIIWGDDIQGMIKADGLYVTNQSNKDNNYTNREFVKFKNALGNSSTAVNISYELYNPKDKGQANTYYQINYFNERNKFVFGIREYSGGWAYGADIITANEEGEPNETPIPLPKGHMSKGGGEVVNLTVRFSGETAVIEIDGGAYTTYTKSEGIKSIKLSVSGDNGYDRDMYIKNYVIKTVEAEAVQFAGYTLKYVCGGETLKEVEKNGIVGDAIVINADEMLPLWNEDNTVKYIFVSDDAEGKTINADGTAVVTLNYRQAENWTYTIKNNVNDKAITGTCIEGEGAKVAFSRYILGENNVIWKKDAIDKQYNYYFTPDANNFEGLLEYTETEEIGVYFVEAEELEGMTATSGNNADIRCSNSAAGYAEEAVKVYTLKPGSYKVEFALWGGKSGADTNITGELKAGEETVLSGSTTGSWTQYKSEEAFTVSADTDLTFSGAIANQPVDYFLIIDASTTAVKGVEAVNGDNKWYNLQGVQVAQPTQPGLYIHNGKKVIVK